ncbi:hypothetical protein ALC57_17743, partial [Trachymyrmex cornetzi]
LEEFQERDSGWALSRIMNLTININKCNPLRAGCRFEVPREIMTKRAVINVRSMDNACSAWSVVAALYPAERNADRESSYPHYTTVLNFQNIEFPITLKDVTKFERLNDVSINVYVIEGQNGQKYICDRCLHYFHSNEKLQLHIVDCQRINDCAIRLPSNDDKWLNFNNYNRRKRVPFVVYADLECILKKTDSDQDESTLTYQYHHQVFSIGYYVRCSYDNSLSKYRFRRDPDCVLWFVEKLRSLAHCVKKIVVANVPMETLSSEQRETLHSATHCHACEKPFALDDNRVSDHCHLTGRYRGPAHSNCNIRGVIKKVCINFCVKNGIKCSKTLEMLTVAYGESTLSKKNVYKWYKLFQEGRENVNDEPRSGRPSTSKTDENVQEVKEIVLKNRRITIREIADDLNISFGSCQSILTDVLGMTRVSAKFVPKLLNFDQKQRRMNIAQDMLNDVNDDPDLLKRVITGDETWKIEIAHERTKIIKDTAERSDSRNNVKLQFIDSYKFLSTSLDKLASFLNKNELRILQCEFQNLSEDDFELLIRKKTDVLLLADIFENFRDKCIESYGLDSAYYYTLLGFAWDAMLKHTRVNFELLTDVDMVMFIERGIHGGLSQCSSRYARANNKYMQSYDPSEPSTYLMFFDVNNLYGWAMCQPLPYLRDYIELNIKFRTLAKNDFEKNLFKLMNNAVFVKTMENVHNHIDVKLLTQCDGRYGAEAMIAKPNFHSRSVFSENLIAIEIRKLEVKFNKPIYVGMCILDISKVCLYEFHHEYMLPLYRKKCEIMYTDTDSLIYRIECDDVYDQMKRDITRFDTSDYSTDNPGLMKDENNGAILTEFVGLRAKMYALDTKKAKGIKSNIVARTITFDNYTRCLNDEIEMTRQQSCIRSKLHQVKKITLYTISETKIALSPYDDKRYIIQNSIKTLPWGHYRIPL